MKKIILFITLLSLWGQGGFAQSVTIRPGTYQYDSVVGTAFHFALEPDMGTQSANYKVGVSGTFPAVAQLHLPNGAKLLEMTAIYTDNSTENLTFKLIRQVSTGNAIIETLALTPTSSSSVQRTTIPIDPIHTTNTEDNIYFVQVTLSNTGNTYPGTTLRIVGVIIKYQLD
jgi:hypothetical protein